MTALLLALAIIVIQSGSSSQSSASELVGSWRTTAPPPAGRDAPIGPSSIVIAKSGAGLTVDLPGKAQQAVPYSAVPGGARWRAALVVFPTGTNPSILYIIKSVDRDTIEVESFVSFADKNVVGTYRYLGTYKRASR